MALIISVANQKGGSGKTTTAQQLACELAVAGYRIHVVDMDPQASLSLWYRMRKQHNLNMFHMQTILPGLLEDELNALRSDSNIDIVVVDCPGNIEDITLRVVQSSDAVICPVRSTSIDVAATKPMVRYIQNVRDGGRAVRLLIFHNGKHAARAIDKEASAELARIFRPDGKLTYILNTAITDTATIAEVGMTGKSVMEYAPKSQSARLYRKLTKEILTCLANEAA